MSPSRPTRPSRHSSRPCSPSSRPCKASVVYATILVGTAVITEAALSFLGAGVEPTPAWGLMVNQGRSYLFTSPHLLFFPAGAILVTVMAVVFVGDGLRDALDPRLRGTYPLYTIGQQISDVVRAHNEVSKAEAHDRAVAMLDLVGIPNPKSRVDDYPHQFSGGMRQRALIAMAIANDPDLIIADEPTTALDVTIQAQVLDVLVRAAESTNSAVILITHDLGVVAGMVRRVAVMYAGQIVEEGPVDDLYYRARMPYSWGLMESITRLDQRRSGRLRPIAGQPPRYCAHQPLPLPPPAAPTETTTSDAVRSPT